MVAREQVVVVLGETGSGKTTQIPQYLYESGYARRGCIGVTQPRRVAAISVAQRVSQEMGVMLGEEVGYSVRFEDCTSPVTRLKYMTDGMLLRELMLDADLRSYSVLILDEAHERSLHTDVLMALVKALLARRPELKVLVMSATLDAEKFSAFFGFAEVAYIQGRQFPISVLYTEEPQSDYVEAALTTVLQLHCSEGAGDVLVFLTGQDEIETLAKALHQKSKLLPPEVPKLLAVPLYAALPPDAQMAVFEPTQPGTRKVILSTNIAETSVTISGVRFVVDCGLAKMKRYNPRIGLDILAVTPISQAAANQRAGRAGREAPGQCFRLYTEKFFLEQLQPDTVPEIQRVNLSSVVLQLKALGVQDITTFEFMDAPPPAICTLGRAQEQLVELNALTDEHVITPLGVRMAAFPLEPAFAKMILLSKDHHCTEDVLSIVSILSADTGKIFHTPKDKRDAAVAARKRFLSYEGDHFTLLNVVRAYQAAGYSRQFCHESFLNHRTMEYIRDVRRQLELLCVQNGIPVSADRRDAADPNAVRRCLLAGGLRNVAQRMPDGTYVTVADRTPVFIHPSSVLLQRKPDWVLFNELIQTTKRYIRDVSVLDASLFAELAPDLYSAAAAAADAAAEVQRQQQQQQRHQDDSAQARAEAKRKGQIALPGVKSAAQSLARPGLRLL